MQKNSKPNYLFKKKPVLFQVLMRHEYVDCEIELLLSSENLLATFLAPFLVLGGQFFSVIKTRSFFFLCSMSLQKKTSIRYLEFCFKRLFLFEILNPAIMIGF